MCKAFIFEHQSYSTVYFRKDENIDDPPVYTAIEGAEEITIQPSFSLYLKEEILSYISLAVSSGRLSFHITEEDW
jgi:hypothetical protein